MVAGIIAVAAADELTVAHPGEPGTLASIILTLGGTGLFLAGHALAKWAVLGVLSWSHVVAIGALIALVPVGLVIPTLALSGAAGLIAVARRGHPRLWRTRALATPGNPVSAKTGLFTSLPVRGQPVEKLSRWESAKPASQLAWPPVPRRRPSHHDGHDAQLR